MRLNLANKISLFLIAFIAAVGVALFFTTNRMIENNLIMFLKIQQETHVVGHALHETTHENWLNPKTVSAKEKFNDLVEEVLFFPDTLRIKIWSPELEVLFTDPGAEGLMGKRFPENESVKRAFQTGQTGFEREEAEEFAGKPEHIYDLGLGEVFEIYVPIMFPGQNKPVGVVEIYQSARIFNLLFADTARFFILILAAEFLILFFVFAVILQYLVHRPLASLGEGAGKIAKGDFDFEIKPSAKDEIGHLAENLDFMRRALKQKGESEESYRLLLLNALQDAEQEKKNTLREKSKTETILTNINDAVVLTDTEGVVVAVNKMFEKVFKPAAKEIINRPFDAFIELIKNSFAQAAANLPAKNSGGANQPPENSADKKNNSAPEALENWFRKAFSSYAILEKELTLNRPLTEYGIVAGTAKPTFKLFTTPAWSIEMTMMGRIWVFSDMSNQKELEKARLEFVSLTSHQLRTPSSGIKAFLELILGGDAGPLTETQTDYLNEIYQSNERMIELVEALLNVSKIESGRLVLEPRPVDLIKLSEEVIEEVMPLIKERKQKFEFIKPAESPRVALDARLIFQVISNLLTNASKYNSEGGSIVLQISKETNEILFRVSDNGWGIPKHQQDKIFTKFFRGDNVVMRQTVGSGLGLYIVKQIVEMSGGRVWFESEENKGTTFYFTLPFALQPISPKIKK